MSNIVIEQTTFLQKIVSDYGGVRRPWIGDTSNPLYKQYKFNTGIDVCGTNVYSYSNGVVLAVGKDKGKYAVTVQYDVFSVLRYTNLKDVSVRAGDMIQVGYKIGAAHNYVHFEYATKDQSNWPVRVGTETYYKQNPIRMLGGVSA